MRCKLLLASLLFPLWAAAQANPHLFEAIQTKNLTMVRQLVGRQPSLVNQSDNFHGSPLNTAVRYGSTDIVAFLLAAGARVDSRESMNFTVLEAAAAANKPEAARLLLRNT